MNTEKLKQIQSKFHYCITDEQLLLNTFKDNIFNIATEIVDGINNAGALKNSKQFIQRDNNQRCLTITIILKENYKSKKLNDFLDSIPESYNASLEKHYELNDGKCTYKLAVYDTHNKRYPMLIFNIVHPLLQQYNLIP